MKLEEVQYKLLGKIQSLPPELALEFCKQAIKEIYKEKDWSFLYKRDILRTPRMINTGTVDVTQYSTDVIVSADLKVILDALTVNDIKIEGRQFRTFGGQLAGSNFIYTITEYNSSTGTLTIDPYYMDEDNANASFQIFKNLYTISEVGNDFANIESIIAPFAQKRIGLELSRSMLDVRDPYRLSMGDPYYIVNYGEDSSSNSLFELYPIPTNARVYRTIYKSKGDDLDSDDDIPSRLDYELILAKAKIKAYEWIAVNGDRVGIKLSPNVCMNLIALASNPNAEDSYPSLLNKAKQEDENVLPQALIEMGESWPFYQEVITETILLDF